MICKVCGQPIQNPFTAWSNQKCQKCRGGNGQKGKSQNRANKIDGQSGQDQARQGAARGEGFKSGHITDAVRYALSCIDGVAGPTGPSVTGGIGRQDKTERSSSEIAKSSLSDQIKAAGKGSTCGGAIGSKDTSCTEGGDYAAWEMRRKEEDFKRKLMDRIKTLHEFTEYKHEETVKAEPGPKTLEQVIAEEVAKLRGVYGQGSVSANSKGSTGPGYSAKLPAAF